MAQNTGMEFENRVFNIIERLVQSNEFLVGEPNVRVRRKAKYYSPDRNSDIECEIAVEKYLGNPDTDEQLRPALIIVVECKDYTNPVSVNELEEFHAKLQQIGADNTKGIMITRTGAFQKSALNYALSKKIALARILPDDQVKYVLHMMLNINFLNSQKKITNTIQALTEKGYISTDDEDFFSLTGERSLDGLLRNLIEW